MKVKLLRKINKIPVFIAIPDEKIKFESHNFLLNVLRVPIILILNILPTKISRAIYLAFSGKNGDTRTVFENIATYRALEVMYTFPQRRKKRETNISDFFWECFLSNARAIRNRLILVKKQILKGINEAHQKKGEVHLLSLGSGSARAVIEAISNLNDKSFIKIKLIDLSKRAINLSKKLAKINKIKNVEWYRDYAENLEKYYDDFKPDIIEMVGLLDYYPKKQATDLISKIYKALSENGKLITCNITYNLESPFVTRAINWSLIYRSPEELVDILIKGGFSSENIKIIYEPFKIHCLAIAKK